MSDDYLAAKKTEVEAIIDALIKTITQLSSGGVKSYTLDTGQGKQVVTREDLSDLNEQLNSYLNLRDVLCTRITTGSGTFNIRPSS